VSLAGSGGQGAAAAPQPRGGRWRRWALGIAGLLLVASLSTAPAGTALAQPASVAQTITAENAELASRIAVEEAALGQERAELARVLATREQLESRLQRITRHAELDATGREFAVMVRRELRALPRPGSVAAAAADRESLLEKASDTSVRAETAALTLAELDSAIARRLAAVPAPPEPAQRVLAEADVREQLTKQRSLQQRLHELARDRQQALRDIARTETDLVQRGVSARVELTRLLFWLPAPPQWHLIADVAPAIEWVASATRWQSAAATLVGEAGRRPLFAAGLALMLAGLLFARGRLKRRLATLAAHAASSTHARMRASLRAIAVTLAIALPLPLLMWGIGSLLATATEAVQFTLELSQTLELTSQLLLALSTCAWLLAPQGLAVGHFGWDEVSVGHAERALRRFTAVFMPLLVMAALNGLEYAPYGNREILGRPLFSIAMIVLAALLARLFRRASPLMQLLADRAPRGWPMRLYPAWYWALLVFPFGMLALAAAGYMTAAGYFFGRTTATLFLVIAAGLLYGLVALWVQVQHWMLERQRAEQGGQHADSTAGDASGGEVALLPPQKIDLAAMSEQTRSLLDVMLTVLLLVGLWWIWKDAVPALSTIGDYVVMSLDATDAHAASAVKLGDIFLTIVIATVTWVAVSNVGALLDTLLLQYLEFQADANYAIKVISRYALTAIGVMLMSRTLGISWGSVQWLVAALGVGLGFGLQEIVANFVSGLIVLAERPVRIGDVVTIGTVTGRVSRIRARATVVVDTDNREVFVPNKSFITERVVNWTLSDTTTRVLLTFGVAYGSDVEAVQRLVLEAVRGTADVMAEPGPSVFFVGLGDKALNFEVWAFVRSLDDVMRVRHAINAAIEQVLRESGTKFPA
jgi:potassium efflux system protein